MIAYFINNQLLVRNRHEDSTDSEKFYGRFTFNHLATGPGGSYTYSSHNNSYVKAVHMGGELASFETSPDPDIAIEDFKGSLTGPFNFCNSLAEFRKHVNFPIPSLWTFEEISELIQEIERSGVEVSSYWSEALNAMRNQDIQPYIRWSRTQNKIGVYYVNPDENLYFFKPASETAAFVYAVRATHVSL